MKKYHTWPIATPIISSRGIVPCITRLNVMRTHGKYGAVNTSRPRKLNRVSGLRRDQMYTKVEERGWPRNGIDTSGDRTMRLVVAYRRSQEKRAGDRPEDSSSSRAYRCVKNTLKRRSRENGPK